MGKSTISMVIFNSYVSLPEGRHVLSENELYIGRPATPRSELMGSIGESKDLQTCFWVYAGLSLSDLDSQISHPHGQKIKLR